MIYSTSCKPWIPLNPVTGIVSEPAVRILYEPKLAKMGVPIKFRYRPFWNLKMEDLKDKGVKLGADVSSCPSFLYNYYVV